MLLFCPLESQKANLLFLPLVRSQVPLKCFPSYFSLGCHLVWHSLTIRLPRQLFQTQSQAAGGGLSWQRGAGPGVSHPGVLTWTWRSYRIAVECCKSVCVHFSWEMVYKSHQIIQSWGGGIPDSVKVKNPWPNFFFFWLCTRWLMGS